jgi:hypothetical protein
LIETAAPPESYWPGYHARLKQRLRAAQQPRVVPGQYDDRSLVARFFTSSIRVPVPVAIAAAILIAVFAFVFSTRVPAEPSIVHVPVEVPVVQERTVERIVYRERRLPRQKPTRLASNTDSTLANLQGFEPADEVKLTVIKGGSANEK